MSDWNEQFRREVNEKYIDIQKKILDSRHEPTKCEQIIKECLNPLLHSVNQTGHFELASEMKAHVDNLLTTSSGDTLSLEHIERRIEQQRENTPHKHLQFGWGLTKPESEIDEQSGGGFHSRLHQS